MRQAASNAAPRAAGQALEERASRPTDRLPLRRVKILGASRVLCYICSLSERLSMTASAEAVPQCHAAVRGHEKVGSSEILVTPKPSSPRAERGVAKDAPGSANEAASWTILRDAMPRIAPSGRGWSHMDPCLAVVFFAASACKALISPVSRSGIAIFCNFLQLSEASKTGEMQLSASFCSKLQSQRMAQPCSTTAHSRKNPRRRTRPRAGS